MELRQVRYFVEVAEKLNFTRAADKIGIAQPALSQQIKQLEIELGGNLFVRTKRKVMLTNAGTLFLAEAKLLLEQAEHAKDIARQVFSGLSGKLVIGFVESSTWEILPKILSIYSKKYPNVKIVLRHLHTNNQVEALKNNTIDIGIIGLPINDSALHIHTIRKDHYWVALQKGHPLSCQKKIHITDLSNEKFITINREVGTIYYDTMVQICMSAGFSPCIVQTANELPTILSLVSCGMGIALIHESAKNYRADLVFKPLAGVDTIAYQLAFAWRKDNPSSAITFFVREFENINFTSQKKKPSKQTKSKKIIQK
jgi:DNA-binding transcriptional LysR family regulator